MNKLFTSRNGSNNRIFCCFRWFNVSPIEDGCLTTPDRTEGRRFALPEASWCSNTWRSAQLFLSALWPVSNWRESSLQDQLKGRGCPSDTRKSSEPMAVRNSSCPPIWNYYLGPVVNHSSYFTLSGVLSHKAVREKIVRAFLIEEQKLVNLLMRDQQVQKKE